MKKLAVCFMAILLLTGCTTPSNGNNGRKTLTVGMECDYAPFNWTQIDPSETAVLIDGGQAGYCDGYDVAVARNIATQLDRDLVIKKIEWDGLAIAVQNGEIDLIIAGMTDTPERRESLDFTSPYYASTMVLIVRANSQYANATSIQDFSGARVVAQQNTFHDDLIDQINGVVHSTPMKTFPLMTVALQESAVDAMVSEQPVAESIVATNPDLIFISFAEGNGFDAGDFETVSIALRKNNTELFNAVQAALDKITIDQRVKMMTDAQGRQPED